VAAVLLRFYLSHIEGAKGARNNRASLAAVKAALVKRGPMELKRTFSGTLEASAEFLLAPKVSGRLERLYVDLADNVSQGQIVAELDDDEYIQAVKQAKADLTVARANLSKAVKALEIANRELKRVSTLRKRGVSSDSQLDEAKASQLASQAAFEVAKAQLIRAEATLETTKIKLSYTKVTADWYGGDDQRVVAERFVDEGETVAANSPLLSIVELSPISGVIYVAEKDYANLRPGQKVVLKTDAYPGLEFSGRIDRIAPVFKETSRQARVEIVIPNLERRLKPGMFIRATVVLKNVKQAVMVPALAVTKRAGETGIFLVDEGQLKAKWKPVKTGIHQDEMIQIMDDDLSGRVVTLGQQLLADGSKITIPDDRPNQKNKR
jgi:RND family efflux transporter MFP subunit